MDDLDDPFKGMVDDEDGEDDNALEELEFDLNQLRETRPDVAPENLDAGRLVDFVREVVTNGPKPLSVVSVNDIVNEYLLQLVETVKDISSDEDEFPNEPISPPSQNEVGMGQLKFWIDWHCLQQTQNPLLLKV